MDIEQGEIVEVNFPLPNEKYQPHPAIVLSNSEVIAEESSFVCVMITSHDFNDDYTYRLKNDMLTKPMKKDCQVRCHLITLVNIKHIIGRHGKIKKQFFKEIILKINKSLFHL